MAEVVAAQPIHIDSDQGNRGRALKPKDLIPAIEKGELARTPTELVASVALLGSTHAKADFRNRGPDGGPGLEESLNNRGVTTFNPQDDNYDIQAEALALNKMSVLGVRLENKKLERGSRGTMVEVDKLWFAILRGQRVVISIESGIQQTFANDEDSARQFGIFTDNITQMKQVAPQAIQVLEGDDSGLKIFEDALVDACSQQNILETALPVISPEVLTQYGEVQEKRLLKEKRLVTVFGSSAPYSPLVAESLHKEQEALRLKVDTKDNDVVILYEGQMATRWNALLDIADGDERARKREGLIQEESKLKQLADIVVITVRNESLSTGTVSEIAKQMYLSLQPVIPDPEGMGFIENPAFGQQVVLLLEPFNANDYIHTAPLFLQDLRKEGLNYDIVPETTFKHILKTFKPGISPTVDKVDEVRRSRNIAAEQMTYIQEMLEQYGTTTGVPTVLFATDNGDFLQKISLVATRAAAKDRIQFWKTYKAFRSELKKSLNTAPETQNLTVQTVLDTALSKVLDTAATPETVEKRNTGLLGVHLKETQESVSTFFTILHHFAEKGNEPYIAQGREKLCADVIGLNHDRLKFLSTSGQTVEDHEVLTASVFRDILPKLGYSEEETIVAANVVRHHENIFRETVTTDLYKSSEEEDRIKTIIFVADILDGAVELNNGVVCLNPKKLQSRFTDLCFRHLDKENGKIFRPEWVHHTVDDLSAFFAYLSEMHGFVLEETFQSSLKGAAVTAFDDVLQTEMALYTGAEKDTLRQIRAQIQRGIENTSV